MKNKISEKQIKTLINRISIFTLSTQMNNHRWLQPMKEAIKYIISFFNIGVINIVDDRQANCIALSLITSNDIPVKKEFLDSCFKKYEANNINVRMEYKWKGHNGEKGLQSGEFIRNSILKNLLLLVNHEIYIDHSTECNREVYEALFCLQCNHKYIYDNELKGFFVESNGICKDCLKKLERYNSRLKVNHICPICIRDRILSIYNDMCYYINKWDFEQLKTDCSSCDFFLTGVLSILLYEVEEIMNGNGYIQLHEKEQGATE